MSGSLVCRGVFEKSIHVARSRDVACQVECYTSQETGIIGGAGKGNVTGLCPNEVVNLLMQRRRPKQAQREGQTHGQRCHVGEQAS